MTVMCGSILSAYMPGLCLVYLPGYLWISYSPSLSFPISKQRTREIRQTWLSLYYDSLEPTSAYWAKEKYFLVLTSQHSPALTICLPFVSDRVV